MQPEIPFDLRRGAEESWCPPVDNKISPYLPLASCVRDWERFQGDGRKATCPRVGGEAADTGSSDSLLPLGTPDLLWGEGREEAI